jgi:hypothetical protein
MRVNFTNWLGGLVSEDLSLRTDLEAFNTCLHVAQNVTPIITGSLQKRKGTVLIDKDKTYKRMFNFNGVLVYIDNELIYVNNQTFSHQFTDLDTLQFISTKDRAFFLQPYIGIYELRYFKATNDYTFLPFIFKYPALTGNTDERTRTPGSSLKLEKLEGENVLVTAEQYKIYDANTTYFLDDIALVNNAGYITPFKMIYTSAKGIPPVDVNYFEINSFYWQRDTLNLVAYPTWDNTVNYAAGAQVYYKGKYYESDINGNLNKAPDVHTGDWHSVVPIPYEQSIFEPDDVGKYIRVNQGVVLIKQVLNTDGGPATLTTINTKVRGDFLVKAVALEAIKDSWFISESEFNYVDPFTYEAKSNITAICLIQQRLVVSTDNTIYFSQIGDYNNFLQSSVTLTSDAFSVSTYSNLTTVVKYLTPWRNGIIVHTDKTLIYVYSDTLISGLTMKAQESVYDPTANCQPVQIQGDVLYISNERLRSAAYSRDNDGLVSVVLSYQYRFENENIIKIVQHYDYTYLLTDKGYVFCMLYDKLNDIKSISKHVYYNYIIDIEATTDAIYLLTNNGRILLTTRDLSVYTDSTVSLLANKELGMLAYDPNTRTIITDPDEYDSNTRYGYQYSVAIQTVNLDMARYQNKVTNIDGSQAIKDVVCRVQDTSHLVINNQDTEIKNGYTGSIRIYEDKRISDWTSGDNEANSYRLNILSLSPFNFTIKGISINVT